MVMEASVNRIRRTARSRASRVLHVWLGVALLGGAFALLSGCAGIGRAPRGAALRISDVERLGDPQTQASTWLVVQGLDAEVASAPQRALSRYAGAIQTDPNNPLAYLALARYYADIGDSERALENLDRTQSLLDPDSSLYRGALPHLVGLRGWVLVESGDAAAAGPLLDEARQLAPAVWDDGRLDASELR